jgi:MoxR-like ATPase
VVDFLQTAHETEERYTVRDGINIARYAIKRLVERGERLTLEQRNERIVGYMKEAATMILDPNAARYFSESLDAGDDEE